MDGDLMTIGIIGATGTVGPNVVDAVLAAGEKVRVITRDPDRARLALPPGIDIQHADLSSHDEVVRATDQLSSLLLLTSHAFDMADLQLRILRAVRRSEVRVVKVSGTSSAVTPHGPYVGRQHWEVERVLEGSGQPYTIVRANAFMQTIVDSIVLPSVRARGTIPNAIGDAGLSMVDAADVGASLAAVLVSDAYQGRTLMLTGPSTVTYADIAKELSERAHLRIPLTPTSPASVRGLLESTGTPGWEAEHFGEMYELFATGHCEFVTEDVTTLLGRAPRSLPAYLDAHTARLQLGMLARNSTLT
jgi:uncharacterized protein YbjT (DUF2867 family)